MSLHLDPHKTALVLIDLQQGIVSRPLSPHGADDVLRNAAALGRGCEETGAAIVRVRVAFSPDQADQLSQPVDAAFPKPAGGLPADWAEFAPEIGALPAAVEITKRQWSAFHGTELDLQLRRRGISTIVLGGIATNFGVESTARDAWQHNYAVVIAEDATTAIGEGMHRFAIENILPRIALIRPTAEILAALRAASR